ncbi:hypothetical protein F4009_07850 [Candidatus Poribacteria bacterium]|nr:hypothetical protein [Candidatus Poribacteria bacterium]MYH81089.1 hypothetical protein [Candidatus Poribacteria bacterium]MYK93897.1 hypothetical protein [Candidatus Poribacteria bacterium]
MKKWHLSTIVFGFTVSLLLMFALTIQTPAETRGSELEGGLQIWIDVGTEPSNRQGEDTFKLGKDDSLAQDFLAGTAKSQNDGSDIGGPAIGDDVVIALAGSVGNAFIEYNFDSPIAGDAFIYCRVGDTRGGGQSMFVVLNSEDHEGDGLIIDTPGNWAWATGRDNTTKSPTQAVVGENTIRIVPREADTNRETLMDIIMISSTDFEPNDDMFKNASPLGGDPTPVKPAGKLTTTWGTIKHRF